MLIGVWHMSWSVSDLERSIAFYTRLGFEVVHLQEQQNEYTEKLVGLKNAGIKVAMMKLAGVPAGLSGHVIELVQYLSPQGTLLSARPCDIPSAHLALITDDANAHFARLSAAGVTFVSPPVAITAGLNQGGFTCYLHDPDGFVLELMQPPPWRLEGRVDSHNA
jgi:catechol 2,3-dioxygenase-like lactoylglutathione lyase family enzyme